MDELAKHICFGCLVCIVLAIGPERCNAENHSSHIEPPMHWDRICPFSDFCTHKAAREPKLAPNEVLCCETCSCDSDCGLQRNCCLYSMDRYRLDERYHTSCTMFSISSTLFSAGMGYKVVDQCANFTPCTSIYMHETPLGSLYPVYSRTSDMIFVNEACAVCNGETDVLKWNVEINCQSAGIDDLYANIAERSKALVHGSGSDCDLKFTPPEQTNVRRHTCINDPSRQVGECLTNYSQNGMTLKELCTGFNASFTNGINGFRYDNIFCHLCIVEFDVPFRMRQLERHNKQICKTDGTARGNSYHIFSLLLSVDSLKSLIKKWNNENEIQPRCDGNIVMERKSGRCRKIRCPEGQIEMDQRCTYISNDWITGPITAVVRLEPLGPTDMVPEKLLRSLSTRKNRIFRSRMKSWDHNEFFVNDTVKNSSHINYFLVWLWKRKAEFDPVNFMADFQNDMKSPWTLRINENTYNFEAKFNKYYKYYRLRSLYENESSKNVDVIFPMSQHSVNETDTLQSVRIGKIFKQVSNAVLTKFFFCEQVDLESEEYVDYGNRLYFNVTNRFLEEAEFRRTLRIDNAYIISVCIEDFDNKFWKPNHSAQSSVSTTDMRIYMAFVTSYTVTSVRMTQFFNL